jgi:hypothetical protein
VLHLGPEVYRSTGCVLSGRSDFELRRTSMVVLDSGRGGSAGSDDKRKAVNVALVNKTAMGLGQTANCPSMEQLQGISDPTDPCQNPIAALPSTPSGPALTLPSAATLNAQLSQSTTTSYLLIGGAVLFVFLLMMGGKR